MAQTVKTAPAMQLMWVQSLGGEDPVEKEMATHSRILAWRIPRTEEPGRLQSMGLQRVRHDWATFTLTHVIRSPVERTAEQGTNVSGQQPARNRGSQSNSLWGANSCQQPGHLEVNPFPVEPLQDHSPSWHCDYSLVRDAESNNPAVLRVGSWST